MCLAFSLGVTFKVTGWGSTLGVWGGYPWTLLSDPDPFTSPDLALWTFQLNARVWGLVLGRQVPGVGPEPPVTRMPSCPPYPGVARVGTHRAVALWPLGPEA